MNFAFDARETASAAYQKYSTRVGEIDAALVQLTKDIESVNGQIDALEGQRRADEAAFR